MMNFNLEQLRTARILDYRHRSIDGIYYQGRLLDKQLAATAATETWGINHENVTHDHRYFLNVVVFDRSSRSV